MRAVAVPPWVVPTCLLIGVVTGVSYGATDDNQATYVPPGLRLVDPAFLAYDWWATATVHYHWAYMYLVAGLSAAGALEWGFALANVLAVAAGFAVIWKLADRLAPEARTIVFALIVCLFFATGGFLSAGSSYLFVESFQPATIAALATLCGVLLASAGRTRSAGLVLAAGGIFHANFLVLNILLFATTFVLQRARSPRDLPTNWRAELPAFLALIGPSLLVAALILPLIMSIGEAPPDASTKQLLSLVFFQVRAPHHYLPTSYLMQFCSLAGWQILGLAWTRSAVPDAGTRRYWYAIQIALGLMIWTATLLTTIVFVEPVSRLFVWRLAPFAVMIGALLYFAGAIKHLSVAGQEAGRDQAVRLIASLVGFALIAREAQYMRGIFDGRSLAILLPAGVLLGLLVLSLTSTSRRILTQWGKWSTMLQATSVAAAAALTVIAAVSSYAPERYNLVHQTKAQIQEAELYAWVRSHTPKDARFATPPLALATFRLRTGRAIIADWKSVPFNAGALIEWYHRLELISGTRMPRSGAEIAEGYERLDEDRLAALRQAHCIDYAVLVPKMRSAFADWSVEFSNEDYVVLKHAKPEGAAACAKRMEKLRQPPAGSN
ncbi:MAG: DUF6798 domain-containing protein [Micropepsaceae bacterium]